MSHNEENNPQPDPMDVDDADTDMETAEPVLPPMGSGGLVNHALEENTASFSRRRPLRNGNGGGSDSSMCNVRRLKHELDEIREHPPPYCCVEIKAENLYHWAAIINGPDGTVYEGGHFRLDIRFPASYPFKPPQIRFITRIYHCNVDRCGTICLDVLGERWSPIITVAKVLLSIYLLMGDCNPDDPLDMYIAEMYKSNRQEHDRIARYWTRRFAMPLQSKDNEKDVPT